MTAWVRHQRRQAGRRVASVTASAREAAQLRRLRRQIDRLDRELLDLLNERAELAVSVGRIKRRLRQPIFDPAREQGVLRQMVRASRGPLPDASIQEFFRTILRHSRRLQMSASNAHHRLSRS